MKRSIPFWFLAAVILALVVGCGGGGGSNRSSGPDNDACDVLGLNTRIVNGSTCAESNSPVVRLVINFSDGSSGTCSGTLITSRSILSAAHCFIDLENPSGARAISAVATVEGIDQTVVNFVVHPDAGVAADNASALNDVAVATLAQDVTTPTLPILVSSTPNHGDIISIYGYGIDQDGNFGGLRSGEMAIDSIDNDHIFALFNGTGSNTCGGDSGGPAVVQARDRDGNTFAALIGVTSTGALANCGSGDTSLFTNLQGSVLSFLEASVSGARFE